MHRFMVERSNIQNGRVTIQGDDLKHLRQVLRLAPGDKIGVFDGTGRAYEANLMSVDKNEAIAEIISEAKSDTEPQTRVTLFQGLPKGEKMELIIQKTVELGIHRIVPVITQRSVVQLTPKDREKKAERWNKIAREAAKQCGRAYVPEVLAPLDFKEAVESFKEFDLAVLLYENEQKKCLKEILKCYTINKIGDIALFIGPEGGFCDREVEFCMHSGYNIAGMGKRILRTETAAISVVSIIMYEMGELQ